jgi:nicotinamide phosphoribosyltransferase
MMRENIILRTDSYKSSHHLQYPPGMTGMFSYFESRGGKYDKTVFFGLQYLIKEYLSQSVTKTDVDEAEAFFKAHGEPFNRAGWERIVRMGRFPIRIRAVPEGTVVPTHNALMTVESTDPETFWIVSWLETMFVRAVWYPMTVATTSWHCKKTILKHLYRSSDDPLAEIDFKLHDFGARGVSSAESAGIGGMAHLVNFKGSDTVEGVRFANRYYGVEGGMAAFSIPAAEHSTITAWGSARELDAYRNMLTQFAKPGALVACVSDSYNLFDVVENIWGGVLRDEVEKSGATVVIRPDSGDPATIVREVLRILRDKVGMTTNKKGYLVLPKYFRVIQGDGVNEESIDEILTTIEDAGFSSSNVGFGMGGALLQQVNRDTQQCAFKCSAVKFGGEWVGVSKDPATDTGKRSKHGRVDLIATEDGFKTVVGEAARGVTESAMDLVFEDGSPKVSYSLDGVRSRANAALRAEELG